jgi:hypothetical protein
LGDLGFHMEKQSLFWWKMIEFQWFFKNFLDQFYSKTCIVLAGVTQKIVKNGSKMGQKLGHDVLSVRKTSHFLVHRSEKAPFFGPQKNPLFFRSRDSVRTGEI